jgi:hypothetical protein
MMPTAFLVIVDSVPKRVFLSRRLAEDFARSFGPGGAVLKIQCDLKA